MGQSWGEQSYFTDTVKCIHLGYFSVKRKEENKLFPVLEIQTEICYGRNVCDIWDLLQNNAGVGLEERQ